MLKLVCEECGCDLKILNGESKQNFVFQCTNKDCENSIGVIPIIGRENIKEVNQ